MTVAIGDMTFFLPAAVRDDPLNGGCKSNAVVLPSVRNSLRPRVTNAERTSGVTRARKVFLCNRNGTDEAMNGAMVYLEAGPNGGDLVCFGLGTQTDTQAEWAGRPIVWLSGGPLSDTRQVGDTELHMLCKTGDPEFPPFGHLYLTNKFQQGPVAANVRPGDSVNLVNTTWEKVAQTDNINYPYGLYLGSGLIMTYHGAAHEEWLQLTEDHITGQVLGTGDGENKTPTLTTITTNGWGFCFQYIEAIGGCARITTRCGGTDRTVIIDAHGNCTGYCTAGKILAGSEWETPLTWITAPDNGENILAEFWLNSYVKNGSTYVFKLATPIAHDYPDPAITFASGVVSMPEVKPGYGDDYKTSISGSYDLSAPGNLVLHNAGAEYDVWTLTVNSGGTPYTCLGRGNGHAGTDHIGTGATFTPINPNTGVPYFELASTALSGSWAAGDTLVFTTRPAAIPIWFKQVVPPGCNAESNDIFRLGAYWE
ncbi:MAG: hypothetical protein HQK58_13675 [Deltaproteobacteria bacterium]|nr:hypothetical protein [Deltaproteobacteria bacterium]